jgi:peptidoglycan/LPS O-acetylase OafA/YrhL
VFHYEDEKMKKEKLLGIELCRGLSTYAVVLVHSGDETWGLPIDPIAIAFRSHFYFAVPFFLATAFYFMTAKLEISQSPKFWRSRIERLVIPYAIWSAIFLVSRAIVFTLGNKPDRLQQLLQDPLSIIFLGSASYHLYFLPLLLAGTSLVLLMPLLNKLKVGKYGLVFLLVVSIFLYHLLEVSGNSFQLGTNVAFQSLLSSWNLNSEQYPLLRLVLVEIAWVIKCLPYFFIALTLNRFLQNAKTFHGVFAIVGWAIAFVLSDTLGRLFLPGALQEVLLAYTLLLFSLALSNFFSEGKVTNFAISMGACSFGIYLLHPFVMNAVKPVITRTLPTATDSISIFSMLLLSIPCFLISWLVVTYLSKNKSIAKYLLGT